MLWDRFFNREKFDFETELARLNRNNKINGIAEYFNVKFEIMYEYCEKYGGVEDGVPVRYFPHTKMYKSIAEKLNTLERSLKIKTILERTKRKRNVQKNK